MNFTQESHNLVISVTNFRVIHKLHYAICTVEVGAHCVSLHLIRFEDDVIDFQIFWSTHVSKIGERNKMKSDDGLWRQPAGNCGQVCSNLYCWAKLAALVGKHLKRSSQDLNLSTFPTLGRMSRPKYPRIRHIFLKRCQI